MNARRSSVVQQCATNNRKSIRDDRLKTSGVVAISSSFGVSRKTGPRINIKKIQIFMLYVYCIGLYVLMIYIADGMATSQFPHYDAD